MSNAASWCHSRSLSCTGALAGPTRPPGHSSAMGTASRSTSDAAKWDKAFISHRRASNRWGAPGRAPRPGRTPRRTLQALGSNKEWRAEWLFPWGTPARGVPDQDGSPPACDKCRDRNIGPGCKKASDAPTSSGRNTSRNRGNRGWRRGLVATTHKVVNLRNIEAALAASFWCAPHRITAEAPSADKKTARRPFGGDGSATAPAIRRSWLQQTSSSPACPGTSRQTWDACCGSRCSRRVPTRPPSAGPCRRWSGACQRRRC